MGKIQLLDDHLSNKIAAGEVVERPASVVKELVENSIDAGSTVIEVFIEMAGLKSIRIVDNGEGIAADDVLNAFERHATSKIKNEHDLFRIRSLGFRGEALPSIASVAHVTLQASTGVDAGSRVVIEGGKLITHEGAPGRQGTDITVANIFFNTPARLKYLKSEATELGNISDVVNRLAISHPEIAFKLVSNEKILLKTAGNGNITQVFASIYGLETAKKMVPFQGESLDFKINGLIGMPEMTRASRNYMTILVNGRYIKNFLVVKAILDGYHTLLPINRYPFVLLSISLDPYLVDVNVHPSKMEVRLSKEKELMELTATTIKAKLQELSLIPAATLPVKKEKLQNTQTVLHFDESAQTPRKVIDYFNEQVKDSASVAKEALPPFLGDEEIHYQVSGAVFTETSPIFQKADNINAGLLDGDDQEKPTSDDSAQSFAKIGTYEQQDSLSAEAITDEHTVSLKQKQCEYTPNIASTEDLSSQMETDTVATNISNKLVTAVEAETSKVPPLYAIGQLHGTYILAQNENGFYMIDQHAAQERMNYEFYKVKIAEYGQGQQELLLPLTIEFPSDKFLKIQENLPLLEEIGLYLSPFGANSFIIRSTPVWFPKGEEEALLDDMIEQVIRTKKADIGQLREEAAIMMSCKASIKANQYLKLEEMQALLDDLRRTNDPFTCPHGRPVILHFSNYEIEKMFKRVMS